METSQAIAERHSTRSFSPRPVARELVERIVDAGRLAATARNEQTWEFVAVTGATARARLAELAVNGAFIAEAPVCVALFCRPTKYYVEDGSAATQNMLVAAADLGVQSCWVAGDKKPYAGAAAKLLKAPADCRLMSLVALGYAARASEPRAPKRPLKNVLHWESF
ncbi:MAG: nitroreductase family protein [Elusimicrobia bacterium]|nr:nitroreductase family protein [Elusimicrobiota bacterium]